MEALTRVLVFVLAVALLVIYSSHEALGQDATSYAGYIQYQHSANRMYFGTSSIGKLLIGQYGFIHAGNDGTFTGDLTGTSSYHSFDSNIAQWTFNIRNRSSQPYGLLINYTTTPNNTSSQFIYCADSTVQRDMPFAQTELLNHMAASLFPTSVKRKIFPI